MTSRLEPEYFEGLYRDDPDPWGFATSEYERGKYRRTVEALEGRRYRRGLEVGCSIGVLTEQLAGSCDHLLALDVSEHAVTSARERLAGHDGIDVARLDLPREMPDGPFDLIVCSEVLYYWSPELLSTGLDRMTRALEPGGSLLAVHWRPRTRTYPMQGDEVHEQLAAELGIEPALSEATDRYRLDRFDLPS